MDKIRVGVVGVGKLGRFHAQKYTANPDAELVGVYDASDETAEAVANEVGTRPYASLDELLREVDCVSVAVPTTLHHETGLLILNQGKHMLMEKPIAATSKEAGDLVDLAEEKDLVLQVGHIERFNPAVTALRDIKMNPKFVEAHRLAPYSPRGADVSVVHDLMIHDIDVLLYMMGSDVVSVDASGVPVITSNTDIANARITFSGKRVANLTASRISLKRMRKFRIFQEDAYIAVNFEKKRAEIYRRVEPGTPKSIPVPGAPEAGFNVLVKKTRAKKNDDALARETSSFIDAVRDGSQPEVGGKAGTLALELAEEITRQCEA